MKTWRPARFGRHRLGHLIQEKLKPLGVHALDDQTEEAAALRRHRPDDILPNMVAQIGHGASFARLHSAAARSWIGFDAAFIAKPQFHLGIGTQRAQFFQKLFSFLFILPFGPGLGHAQMKVQFMQPA